MVLFGVDWYCVVRSDVDVLLMGAAWCVLVWIGAGWCRLVLMCADVLSDAKLCRLVRIGANVC